MLFLGSFDAQEPRAQGRGLQDSDLAVSDLDLALGFKPSQEAAQGAARKIAHMGEFDLVDVDTDRLPAIPVDVPQTAGAEQDGDTAMEFVTDRQIVDRAERKLRIAQRQGGDIAPGGRIARGDIVDRMKGQKQNLAIASRGEADDPVAAEDRGTIAAPVARSS